MEIGIGLDGTLNLSFDEQAEISREAAELGYRSIWTPEGVGEDSFLVCAHRWAATRDVVPGGIGTGISVSPVATRTPLGFAMSAGTMSKLTGGRFVLGIGAGRASTPSYRESFGIAQPSALTLMGDYVTAIKKLVAGETLRNETPSYAMRRGQLAIAPAPNTPVYLAALGPAMLRLAGEVADGAALNWCSREQVSWSRDRIAEGAQRAGRAISDVNVMEYIRICVDDDVAQARRVYARAVISYALIGPPDAKGRATSYRGSFERMGFGAALAEVDRRQAANAPEDDVLAAVPDDLLLSVGYFGRADGAAAAFADLATGLDTAVVRVVAARPGIEAVRAVMHACAPAAVEAAHR